MHLLDLGDFTHPRWSPIEASGGGSTARFRVITNNGYAAWLSTKKTDTMSSERYFLSTYREGRQPQVKTIELAFSGRQDQDLVSVRGGSFAILANGTCQPIDPENMKLVQSITLAEQFWHAPNSWSSPEPILITQNDESTRLVALMATAASPCEVKEIVRLSKEAISVLVPQVTPEGIYTGDFYSGRYKWIHRDRVLYGAGGYRGPPMPMSDNQLAKPFSTNEAVQVLLSDGSYRAVAIPSNGRTRLVNSIGAIGSHESDQSLPAMLVLTGISCDTVDDCRSYIYTTETMVGAIAKSEGIKPFLMTAKLGPDSVPYEFEEFPRASDGAIPTKTVLEGSLMIRATSNCDGTSSCDLTDSLKFFLME